MGTLKDIGYKVVKNFLTDKEATLIKEYCTLRHKINWNDTNLNDFVQNNNGDTSIYADPLTEALMISKTKLMEQESGLRLFPTYSFWRMYTYNAELKPHLDRESCEISVTVMFGSDGTSWPFFVKDKKIELEPGDAVLYLGTQVKHWRESFTGDWHAQGFLHYVDQGGPYADWKKDKRSHFALRNEYLAKQESLRKRKKGQFKEIPIKENK